MYARAVGRGKTAEADAVWGESLANEVIAKGKMILKEPKRGYWQDRPPGFGAFIGFPVIHWFEIGRRAGICPFWRTAHIPSCIFKLRPCRHFGLRR